jgi:hypothetical protein
MPAIVRINASGKQLKALAKHAADTRMFPSYMRADQAVPIHGGDHAAFAYHVGSSHAVRTVPPADLELTERKVAAVESIPVQARSQVDSEHALDPLPPAPRAAK